MNDELAYVESFVQNSPPLGDGSYKPTDAMIEIATDDYTSVPAFTHRRVVILD